MTAALETERLILRRPQAGDVAPWMAFCADDRSKHIRAADIDDDKAWRAWAGIIGHWTIRGYGTFVFARKETPDAPLGLAGPWHPNGWPERELGWSIWSAENEGEGYVREAAEAARAHAVDYTVRRPSVLASS